MNYQRIALIILFIFHQDLYPQEIYGKVADSSSKPLENIIVTLKTISTPSIILSHTITNEFGEYSVHVADTLDSFILEYNTLSFKTKTIYINDFVNTDKPYLLNVFFKNKLFELDEVLIKTIKKSIIVKKDTVTYAIENFKDGTENVIEDLIKKLPGIKVNKNGKISFKGNPIKTVLLDGSNLFDDLYTIGTRNINIDLVESLSAIENYVENPLLHGIKNTNTVVINLTLKKGETDYSNDTSLGLGIEEKLDLNNNTLGISKKMKSFTTISYNNIGKEKSPYDYFSSNSYNLEEIYRIFKSPPNILDTGNFSTQFSEERERINNNLFSNLNTIYQINEALSLRVNIDYKKDRLNRTLLTETIYQPEIETNDINKVEKLIKNPSLFKLKLKFNYKISKKSLLEYNGRLMTENIITYLNTKLNDTIQNSSINSKKKYLTQYINFTKRINNKKALISSVSYNRYTTPQNLEVNPDFRFNTLNQRIISSNQNANLKKETILISSKYIYNSSKINIEIGAGYNYHDYNLVSELKTTDSLSLQSKNNVSYKISTPWLNSNLFYKKNNWSFRTILQINYLSQTISNTIESKSNLSKNKITINPKINLKYNLNEISYLTINTNYSEKPIEANTIFKNVILISNTSAINNIPKLNTLRKYNFGVSYNFNDFFNLFQFYSKLDYSKNLNNLFTSFNIDGFFTTSSRELLNICSDSYSLSFGVDKYIRFLKSNLRLDFSYNLFNYKNIINNSNIRNNINHTGFLNINFKTGFLGKLNFENTFQINTSIFKSLNNEFIGNWSLQNNFNVYINLTKRLNIVTGFDYHLPNTVNKEIFIFFDSVISLSSKNGKINYSIISKNLTPKQNIFQSTALNDFSKTITTYNLLKPYLLFAVDFKL